MDIKVLLVDDEILILDYLENLISWKTHHCTVIGKAVTARRALEIVRTQTPDLIFMDIKMPVMDGLTLSELILQEHPQCRIIILTAYADFEYAQKAIRLGISQFLLKHELNQQSIEQTLVDTIALIKKDAISHAHVINQGLYQAFVCGEHPEHVTHIFRPKKQYWLLMLKLPELRLWGLETAQPFEQQMYREVQRIATTQEYVCGFCRLPANNYLLLCQFDKTNSQHTFSQQQHALIAQLGGALQSEHVFPCQMLYSENLKTFDDIVFYGKEYAHITACMTLKYRPVISLDEVARPAQSTFDLPTNLAADLLRYAKSNTVSLPDLNSLIQTDGKFVSIQQLQPLSLLIQEFTKIRHSLLLPDYAKILPDLIKQYHLNSLEQLLHWLIEELSLLQNENLQYSNTNQRKITQAVTIIHQQFHQDLSSGMIAEQLELSDGHFRAIFKAETGTTVHDFIEQTRISKAKELLDTNQYRIYEIAERCGFKTSQHFSAVFKQRTNLSPKEYANGRREHK